MLFQVTLGDGQEVRMHTPNILLQSQKLVTERRKGGKLIIFRYLQTVLIGLPALLHLPLAFSFVSFC